MQVWLRCLRTQVPWVFMFSHLEHAASTFRLSPPSASALGSRKDERGGRARSGCWLTRPLFRDLPRSHAWALPLARGHIWCLVTPCPAAGAGKLAFRRMRGGPQQDQGRVRNGESGRWGMCSVTCLDRVVSFKGTHSLEPVAAPTPRQSLEGDSQRPGLGVLSRKTFESLSPWFHHPVFLNYFLQGLTIE